MKTDKIEDLATDLAKVLKFNPELVSDPKRFDELVLTIEIRMLSAYFTGREEGEGTEEPEDKPNVTLVIPPPPIPHIPLN